MTEPLLLRLVAAHLGPERAGALVGGLHVHPSLLVGPTDSGGAVPRAVVAQALGVLLLQDLLDRVPSAAAYAEDRLAAGGTLFLDHGAVRTVTGVDCGALPPGQEALARVLVPLGYVHRFTYDLAALRMTGRSWCHQDLPAHVLQYFVSELHADRFSPAFQAAAARVLDSSADPLDDVAGAHLARLGARRELEPAQAEELLPVLVGCFSRHHADPDEADYEALLAESDEMAWIATEGTAFNHATDRVDDVMAVAGAERAAGRPVKDEVEVSGSGRILQTAHRAALVARSFRRGGDAVTRTVPGSFFELITRLPLPDGSGPDLAFDAANAQGIFTMTRRASGGGLTAGSPETLRSSSRVEPRPE